MKKPYEVQGKVINGEQFTYSFYIHEVPEHLPTQKSIKYQAKEIVKDYEKSNAPYPPKTIWYFRNFQEMMDYKNGR